jgi:hypothetical protein
MKTMGVLGGISPQATMDFEARVHRVSQRLIPQDRNSGYPPMVVWYHRRLPIKVGDDGRPVARQGRRFSRHPVQRRARRRAGDHGGGGLPGAEHGRPRDR